MPSDPSNQREPAEQPKPALLIVRTLGLVALLATERSTGQGEVSTGEDARQQ
jgi:hypothetical protein